MIAPRLLAASSAALAALVFGAHVALAGSATWLSTGTNGGWHDAANWTPATVPNGPSDVATFGSTDQLVPFALLTTNTEVNGIVFNPGAPTFSIGGENVTFTISGTGITNNSAAIQVVLAAGTSGVLRFQNNASAGAATSAIAGQNGGTVLFTGSSTGGTATLVAQSTGNVDISGLTTPGMTAGLIATDNTGSNFFRLGSKTLTVGGANLDSTVWGVIADGGSAGGVGGSIVKIGTGTMTYAGFSANIYTGTTFVNEGTLVLNKPVEAIRGPLVVGDASGAAGSAVLQCIGANEIINDSQTLTVNNDGRFELGAAVRETIGALTMNTGNVRLFILTRLSANGPLVMTGGTIEAPSGPGNPGMIFLRSLTIQATSASDGSAAIVSAPVRLDNGFPFTFTVSDGPGATDMLISGTITADPTATIVKAGAGVMVLSEANLYEGSTTINAGTLSISSDANLGTPPGSPTANHLVFDGGTLRATADFTLHERRGIALHAGGGTAEVAAGLVLNIRGGIAGGGSLTKTGSGSLVLSGPSANSYTGMTAVNDGTLWVSKVDGQNSLASLVVGDGLGAAGSAVARIANGNQISDAAPVTIHSDGLLGVAEFSPDTIGALTLTGGNVQIAVGATLTVNGRLAMTGGTIVGGTTTLFGDVVASSDASGLAATISSIVNLGAATRTFAVNDGPGALDLHVSAPITNGGITKTGAGTLALGDANTYSGPTTVVAGKLVLTGSLSNSTTVVANGAILQGTGTTGPLTINSGGTLVPGLSVGTLTTSL